MIKKFARIKTVGKKLAQAKNIQTSNSPHLSQRLPLLTIFLKKTRFKCNKPGYIYKDIYNRVKLQMPVLLNLVSDDERRKSMNVANFIARKRDG